MRLSISLIIMIFVLSGCLFNSTIDFTDEDVKGKTSLILNGDFEGDLNKESSLPEGWLLLESNSSLTKLTLEENEEGQHCVISNVDESVTLISDSFDVYYKGAFYINGKIKKTGNQLLSAEVLFMIFDNEGKNIQTFKKRIKLSEKWKEFKMSASYLKNSSKFARVLISLPKNDGSYEIDNINCFEVYKFKN